MITSPMTTPVILTCPDCEKTFVGAGYDAIAADYILHGCVDLALLAQEHAARIAEREAPQRLWRSAAFREGQSCV